MVGVLAVWLVAALIGALLRRRTVPEEPGRLPIAVEHEAKRLRSQGERRAQKSGEAGPQGA